MYDLIIERSEYDNPRYNIVIAVQIIETLQNKNSPIMESGIAKSNT